MTFIQPNKNNSLVNTVLFFLSFILLVAAFSLIVLYNRSVNFEHGISEAKTQFKAIGTQNVEIEDKIFSLIDSSKSESLASGRLVPEKNPKYVEVNKKWSYASQY